MNEEQLRRCPACGRLVDATDPLVVYAFEQREIVALGPTRQVIDGMPAYFHRQCWPTRNYREAERPA